MSAFLAASRDGNFDALLEVLSPDVTLHVDDLGVRTAAANDWGGAGGATSLPSEAHGARDVANAFKGRARGASPAVINGDAGAVWAMGGRLLAAFVFTVKQSKIAAIRLVMDPSGLSELDIELLNS